MLNNKIIIVTGGNGLIGSEIIKHLKKNHAIVINLEINVKDNFEIIETLTYEQEKIEAIYQFNKDFVTSLDISATYPSGRFKTAFLP